MAAAAAAAEAEVGTGVFCGAAGCAEGVVGAAAGVPTGAEVGVGRADLLLSGSSSPASAAQPRPPRWPPWWNPAWDRRSRECCERSTLREESRRRLFAEELSRERASPPLSPRARRPLPCLQWPPPLHRLPLHHPQRAAPPSAWRRLATERAAPLPPPLRASRAPRPRSEAATQLYPRSTPSSTAVECRAVLWRRVVWPRTKKFEGAAHGRRCMKEGRKE